MNGDSLTKKIIHKVNLNNISFITHNLRARILAIHKIRVLSLLIGDLVGGFSLRSTGWGRGEERREEKGKGAEENERREGRE